MYIHKQLTPKQKLFVKMYCGAANFNAAEAARRAGYAMKSSHVEGSRLLANANMQEAIEQEKAKVAQKIEINSQMIHEGLLREAQNPDNNGSTKVQAWTSLGRFVEGEKLRTEESGSVVFRWAGDDKEDEQEIIDVSKTLLHFDK